MKFNKSHSLNSREQEKKSNIYVYVELTRLIQKLETDKKKLQLVDLAAYFHLINPKDLSTSLAPDWIAVLNFVGFDSSVRISNAEMMQAPIRERVNRFKQEDFEKLMAMLHDLQSRLEAELNG